MAVNPQDILVIHPGSLYIRIGRASDVNPCTVLNAIARKRKPDGIVRVDTMLPSKLTFGVADEEMRYINESNQTILRYLQSYVKVNGKKRPSTTTQQVASFNRRVVAEIKNPSGGEWHYCDDEFMVGDEILNLDPHLPYNIHFPVRHGELNINNGVSSSFVAIMDDLKKIWSHIICYHLEIDQRDLHKYKVVLVVPDIFNRSHAAHLVNLLLCEMKFSACFLLQDHVAATFGAGLSAACVIDVGHSKLSISCVEDAVSIPRTRIRFGYGGADVTQAFHWLLQKCEFPYAKCNPSRNKSDAFLLQKLKHDYCHINMEVSGISKATVIVRQPKQPLCSYTIQMGDECVIPVMGIFYPGLFRITGPKFTVCQSRLSTNHDDLFDEDYFQEIARRNKDTIENVIINDVTDDIHFDSAIDGSTDFMSVDGNPIGLDLAIIRSIERCGSTEQKRKFYGSILITGGGIKFKGITEFIKNRIKRQIPFNSKVNVEVYTSLKDIDSENTSWKGAAITATLDTARELWIQPNEWKKFGSRLLREKSHITW